FDDLYKSTRSKSKAFFDTVPVKGESGSDAPKPSANSTNANGSPKPADEPKTKRVPHIVSLETPDPQTVVITVTRPALKNQLLSNLVAIPIIPEGTVGQQKEQPLGSGPFKFVSFDASQNSVELSGITASWDR